MEKSIDSLTRLSVKRVNISRQSARTGEWRRGNDNAGATRFDGV